MARVKIQAGAELDLLNKGELHDALDESLRKNWIEEWTERARGIRPVRIVVPHGVAVSSTTAYVIEGPNMGYVWALRFAGFSPSASSNIRVWVTGDNTTTVPTNGFASGLVANNVTAASFTTFSWSGTQALVYGGEYVAITANTSVTTDIYLTAVEIPAQLAWKIV